MDLNRQIGSNRPSHHRHILTTQQQPQQFYITCNCIQCFIYPFRIMTAVRFLLALLALASILCLSFGLGCGDWTGTSCGICTSHSHLGMPCKWKESNSRCCSWTCPLASSSCSGGNCHTCGNINGINYGCKNNAYCRGSIELVNNTVKCPCSDGSNCTPC